VSILTSPLSFRLCLLLRQVLPTPCVAGSATQQWEHYNNSEGTPSNLRLHLRLVKDGRCLAIFNGGTGTDVGVWGCGTDDPSGQGWDITPGPGGVHSRDKGSPTLCMAPAPTRPPQPPPPSPPTPKNDTRVYNQNAACKGAYTKTPSLCEGVESHPAVLLALGMLPGASHGIDTATMNRTLDLVAETWDWDGAWGWDFGLTAMTAARLNRTDAVDHLLHDSPKNSYLTCGCNAPLTCYLPGRLTRRHTLYNA
jgi:hypothetical protein